MRIPWKQEQKRFPVYFYLVSDEKGWRRGTISERRRGWSVTEGRKIEGLLIACEWKQPGADIKVSQKQVHDLVDEIGIPTVWLSRRVLSQ